jgi:hypothetical protein
MKRASPDIVVEVDEEGRPKSPPHSILASRHAPRKKAKHKIYKYESPPEDPTICCFEWLPNEMRLYIIQMVRPARYPELEEAYAPMIQKDQWACAMTCRWMRGMVDPMVRRYLEWARGPHDKSIVPGADGWPAHSLKYYMLADADDPELVAFVLARSVHHLDLLDEESKTRCFDSAELVFHMAAAAAGSLKLLHILGLEGFYRSEGIEHWRKWFTKLSQSAASHGRLETVKYLYQARVESLNGVRAIVSSDQIWSSIVRPAIHAGHINVIRWGAEHVDLVSKVETGDMEQNALFAALAAPRPNNMFKWLFREYSPKSVHSAILSRISNDGKLELLRWVWEHTDDHDPFRQMGIWIGAVRRGFLDILKWGYEQGVIDADMDSLCSAVSDDHPQVLRWIHEVGAGCSCVANLTDFATATGRQHVLDWIRRNSLRPKSRSFSVCSQAIRMHDLGLLEWALRNKHAFESAYDRYSPPSPAMVGNEEGPIEEVIAWLSPDQLIQLYKLGATALVEHKACILYANRGMTRMVRWGVVEIMEIASDYGEYCDIPLRLINYPAERGDLDLCKWLFEKWYCQETRDETKMPKMRAHPPQNIVNLRRVANKGDRRILEWAHNAGVLVFHQIYVIEAYNGGHPDVAEWIYRRGGDFIGLTYTIAAMGHKDCLRWARETLGAPWGTSTFKNAIMNGYLDLAEYCYAMQCPFRPSELWHAAKTGAENNVGCATKWLKSHGIYDSDDSSLHMHVVPYPPSPRRDNASTDSPLS